MADEKNDKKKENVVKSTTKLSAIKAVKELRNDDSQWLITQEILQEIMASYTVANPDSMPPVTHLIEDLKKEVEAKYKDEPETVKLLLESIPAARSVRVWIKKDGWNDAVWEKVRGDQLFSADKRAHVIESLRVRACEKSDQAAKIWLTLSGDYQEKMEVNDKTMDAYREINNILHRKRREED